MMNRYRHGNSRRFYRSRNGVIFGVCSGLAKYFDFNVFWIRAICVLFLFLSGLWPILGIYILASLIMKPEPVRPINTEEEQEFYDTYVHSPNSAVQRIKQRYGRLEKRIRRMEDSVTSREFEWDRKMNA